ncbi:hypothetical protein TRVL_03195 [Trypanosoma vivax]|nr:hypothetical protein TRVL_03195 [Trypanosoma vivax]
MRPKTPAPLRLVGPWGSETIPTLSASSTFLARFHSVLCFPTPFLFMCTFHPISFRQLVVTITFLWALICTWKQLMSCRCLRLHVKALGHVPSPCTSLHWRGSGSVHVCTPSRGCSASGGEPACVTPFFASLFPTYFAQASSCSNTSLHYASILRRAQNGGNAVQPEMQKERLTISTGKGSVDEGEKIFADGVSTTIMLRSWHVIGNLKNAELRFTNELGGSEGSWESQREAECSQVADSSPRHNVMSAASTWVASIVRHPTTCDEADTERVAQSLETAPEEVMWASSHIFHHIFEALVREGRERLAIELFRRWWRRNPQLFPLDLHMLQSRDFRTQRPGAGEASGSVFSDGCMKAISEYLVTMPGKKYLISSALFCRVLMVALKLGDAVLEEFVLEEIVKDGVFGVVCRGAHLYPGLGVHCEYDTTSNKVCFGGREAPLHAAPALDLRFDPYVEKYEDWLVLIASIAAAAVLERHADDFSRECLYSASYTRLVHQACNEFMEFVHKCASLLQDAEQQGGGRTPNSPLVSLGWAKLLFVTVLRCYEESGVFHSSPARRPGNAARLWSNIHLKLLTKFPHVFHAGNTVTTLLSLGALEEVSVSSRGTHRLSFFGKEQALHRWRLECLSHTGTANYDNQRLPENAHAGEAFECSGSARMNGCFQNPGGASFLRASEGIPRASKRLRTRMVVAYSSLTNAAESAAGSDHEQGPLHWKHRERFNVPSSVSFSRLSIPVFPTVREVHRCAEDAVDEISDAWDAAIDIFRAHSSLPVLSPWTSTALSDVSGGQLYASKLGIASEMSKPSMFLLLRLVSLLASMGDPLQSLVGDCYDREGGCTSNSTSLRGTRFPLLECIERDLVPFCHATVVTYLRRCCATFLSRSGRRGVQALFLRHHGSQNEEPLLLEKLNEDVAMERLLFGLLWSGGAGTGVQPLEYRSSHRFSFGSGSMAWLIIAQQSSASKFVGKQPLLTMVLSHLATLSLAIPDDYRHVMFFSPFALVSCTKVGDRDLLTEERVVCDTLHEERCRCSPPAFHLYISLLQLLSCTLWHDEAAHGQSTCQGTVANTVHVGDCGNCESNSDQHDTGSILGGGVPSLEDSARHRGMVRRLFRSTPPSSFSAASFRFTPVLLERIALILLHTCVDIELLLACLFLLLDWQHHLSRPNGRCVSGGASNRRNDAPGSLFTPRLLTCACGLLLANGICGRSVQDWRKKRGATFRRVGRNNSLYMWHRECFERSMPPNPRLRRVNVSPLEHSAGPASGSSDNEGDPGSNGVVISTCAARDALHLLGSVVLDVLLTENCWESLRMNNFHVASFVRTAGTRGEEMTVASARVSEPASAGPLTQGVVLPSIQISSSYRASARQRVTNIKDALRDMEPERRRHVRRLLSPDKRLLGESVLTSCTLVEALGSDESDEPVSDPTSIPENVEDEV